MAYGIEEIAEMQITGPVQGGDMVAKPNEMPTGAAALLNKMQRKSTPGIFKLPMPDKEMPNFMKVAAEGVEQQTAKGDTINQMAGELIRQGIDTRGLGMDEIIKIYEETFGSPGDVDQFGVSKVDPSDWRTILQMINSGMSEEQIEEQMAMNTMKNRAHKDAARVEAFAPEGHQLAYITPDEQDMLRMMGGSGETNPMTGIKQFPQYGGATGASDEDEKAQAYGYQSYGGPDTPGTDYQTSREASGMDQEWTKEGLANVAGILADDAQNKQLQKDIDKAGTQQPGLTPTFMETIVDKAKDVLFDDPLYQSTSEIPKYDEIEKLINEWKKADVKLKGFGVGDIFTALAGGPYKDKDKLWREVGEGEDEERTLEGLRKEIKKLGGDKAIESLKHLKPELYYKFVDATTGGATEELSKAKLVDLSGYKREDRGSKEYKDKEAHNRKVFEAREVVARQKDAEDKRTGKGRRYGGGSDLIEEKLEEIVETTPTTTDSRAGQFNVGGTMPYTEDIRTAGVETDVPLGRRFEIDKEGKYRGSTGMDLSEAMKYATLGGYGQLEPFQEYLTRRRKHLGEDEPRYFDEEGNVIYSDVTGDV